MRLKRSAAVAATGVAIALVAGACSSDGDKTSASSAQQTESSSQAPEDVKAPDAAVTAGLQQIQGITGQLAQAVGTDKAKAEDLNEQIEPAWQQIEGTIKSNDAESYLTFEDNFAAMGNAVDNADTAKAQQAATAVAAAVATYLAKYPG